jgi:hypothetical protein
MQAALVHLRQSTDIHEDDVARLSPVLHRHINVLGHYSFTLAEQVGNGLFRPRNFSNDDILIP